MSKVLVIGKNSYIAKNLLHLTKEWNVKNQYDAVSASSGEWETYSFETYDTVIMLAAIVHKKETDENRKL